MTLVKIVYASMAGDTEGIADIVVKASENLELEVEVNECVQVDTIDFEEADICIVTTYTYGGGDSSDGIVDFYEDLQEIDLSERVFGVCGLGDTFYDDFCKSVDDFEAVLTQVGAKKGADSAKVDSAAEEDDIQRLEEFVKKLAAAVE